MNPDNKSLNNDANAKQNYAKSLFNLAVCYDVGYGCEKNVIEAFKYFKLAAEQNYARAQLNLGVCYSQGDGCEKNNIEAFKNYKLAAEQNLPEAHINLGVCYSQGIGCDKNDTEAFKYFKLAAEQNHTKAKEIIGPINCLLSLSGTKKRGNNYVDKSNNCKKQR